VTQPIDPNANHTGLRQIARREKTMEVRIQGTDGKLLLLRQFNQLFV